MRLVASLAALLLFAMGTVVYQDLSVLELLGLDAPASSAAPLQIRLHAAAEGQLGALHGMRPVANRLLVNDEVQGDESNAQTGLRLWCIDPAGRVGALQHFALAEEAAELERLIGALEAAPMDTLFAMSIGGRVEPAPDGSQPELRARLVRFFQSIGAQTQPAESGRCSFVYLFTRRPAGLVPLAESFSNVQGVALSFQVRADRSAYDDFQSEAVVDERSHIFLPAARAQGAGLLVEPKLHLGARPYQALSAPVSLGTPGSLSWRLGSAAGGPMQSPLRLAFESRVGLSPGAQHPTSGVHFELFIDGQRQAERVLFDASSQRLGWQLWSASLDPGLRQVDRIEIRMTRFGPEGTPELRAYLGQPRMRAGSTGQRRE